MPTTPSLYDLDAMQLADLLDGQPRYRLDQVWQGLYKHSLFPYEISNVPKALRETLIQRAPMALTEVTKSVSDIGDTTKWLWRLIDGSVVETVLMLYPDRATVCVSTQAGCAMACGFCATGQAGFERNLTAGEIVEQLMRAQRAAEGRRVSNIVYMGMGEPMANFDRMWASVNKIHGDVGISARHLTISTVGIIPGIKRLTEESLPVNLAVSLHAANDTLRDELVPINKRYPLDDLAAACAEYVKVTRRRLSLEWALIADTNDRDSDARELADYARSLGAHINLIPLNPTPGYPVMGTSPQRVNRFVTLLTDMGANATVRRTRGTEIDAACGQLAAGRPTNTLVPLTISRAARQDQ